MLEKNNLAVDARQILVTVSFLLLLAAVGRADALDEKIKAIMAERNIPGAAVAVVKGGRTVMMKGYGVASLEFGVPVTTDTVFEIGSVSKQMTAAGIMLLAQDGKVALDEKISVYLPNTPEAWREVTVRHLLTHTSGIKSYSSLDGFELWRRMTVGDFVGKLSPHPLEFTPGERNVYSNSGYNLLAFIIEQRSGKTYLDFMRERIFTPLGMTRTGDRDPQFVIRQRATGYEWRDGRHTGRDGSLTDLTGAGSITSTIADMVKWENALRGEKFLTAESKKQIWTQFKFSNGKPSPYGLGWRISDVRGHKLIGHTGQTAGFGAALFRYTDDNVTAIALTNLGEIGMGSIIATIAAKHFVPSLSLRSLKTSASIDPALSERIIAAITNRFANRIDTSPYTAEYARSISSARARAMNERIGAFAPVGQIRFVKNETIDGRSAVTVIVETKRRLFQWRALLDENGRITELNLEEEE